MSAINHNSMDHLPDVAIFAPCYDGLDELRLDDYFALQKADILGGSKCHCFYGWIHLWIYIIWILCSTFIYAPLVRWKAGNRDFPIESHSVAASNCCQYH